LVDKWWSHVFIGTSSFNIS